MKLVKSSLARVVIVTTLMNIAKIIIYFIQPLLSGKGVYFADMVSKSANYCNTSSANNTGLLLLCEVALGDM